MFELYHNDMSVCSQRVRVVLREKGIEVKPYHLDLRACDSMTPEYLKLNPNGVVPTLVHDGAAIVESAVISEYLEDVYPQPALRPADPVACARMRVWAKIPDDGIHAACAVMSNAIAFRHQFLAMPKADRERNLELTPDPARRERKRQGIEYGLAAPFLPPAVKLHDRTLAKMEQQLQQTRWLAGDDFTLADIALIPYVVRLEHLAQSWMWTESRPAVGRWLDQCRKQVGYLGVSEYIVPAAVTLMSEKGREAQDKIRSFIKG